MKYCCLVSPCSINNGNPHPFFYSGPSCASESRIVTCSHSLLTEALVGCLRADASICCRPPPSRNLFQLAFFLCRPLFALPSPPSLLCLVPMAVFTLSAIPFFPPLRNLSSRSGPSAKTFSRETSLVLAPASSVCSPFPLRVAFQVFFSFSLTFPALHLLAFRTLCEPESTLA